MMFEAFAATFEADAHVADPAVRAPAAANDDAPGAAPGWATANPDKALLLLFVAPRPGVVLDELLAL